MKPVVLGVDFGTDSVRVLAVEAKTGRIAGSAVEEFSRWKKGLYCDPPNSRFRQHPRDYIESLEKAVRAAVESSSVSPQSIAGIGIDTTGSTPVAVNREGVPLSMTADFEENPNAMFVLWKDHTAVEEADEINRIAGTEGEGYTRYEGGIYSSEWFWSKILHVLREDRKVRAAAFSLVEHCDWMPGLLTGNTDPLRMRRSRCAAGHKAMWHASWNGLPTETFLVRLDPLLRGIRDRLYTETFTCDVPAGDLTAEWADRLGLKPGIPVAAGAFDAHLGAVGAGIEPYHLCKVMGTSTCDMMVAPMEEMGERCVRGICGQVDGSIIPGMLGMEAGQSAFGDVYAWFRDLLLFPLRLADAAYAGESVRIRDRLLDGLSSAAERLPVDPSGIVALDWLNGRRTPDANQRLKAGLTGLNLASDAPRIFRALVEATAFGARAIADRFRSEGVPIRGVIALGGVARKSPFVLQTVSDVLNAPIRLAAADQAVALGSAMAAAAAAGIYSTIEASQKGMGHGFERTYKPDSKNAALYDALYQRYTRLGSFAESEILR